ncbi:MAG TPA: alpha/beta fold hydrolase [Planctomycetota bacterium]|nr:alpha/beta fold hydrolase [Planctomycetota bacterium]
MSHREPQEIPLRIAMKGGFLAATLHIPAGRAPRSGWPSVLMSHGFTGNRIETHFLFVKASRAFAEKGFASLRFDFRGSGESSGRFQDMSILTEVADALAAWEFLGRLRGFDADRRCLLGLSFGGAASALLAGGLAAEGREPAGCVLWSAVGDIGRLWDRRIAAMGRGRRKLRFPLERSGHLLGRRFFEDIRQVPRPIEALGASGVEALIVHGTADDAVPVADARAFAAACRRGLATLRVLPGYDHTFARSDRERKVIALTAAWLCRKI